MTDFHSRYVAYARSHGRDPEAQLAYDRQRWPGGSMTGYTLWIEARWREWSHLADRSRDRLTDADHVAFDVWLAERTEALYAHAERLANDPSFLAEVIACERRLADGEPLAGLTADEFKARYFTEVDQ